MKILIDINHPAHVHYFKNMIKIMTNKNYNFKIISRNKEIEHYLLTKNKIDFISRGEGAKSFFSKIKYFFYAINFIIKEIKLFKPDLIISFGTPYPAIASKICKIDHISINDTEHAGMHHALTDPFSKTILTPSCYKKNIGKKQLRFDSYMELSYLHPKYFKPDPSIYDLLGIEKKQKYMIVRFVSWNAVHDYGHMGLTLQNKIKAVKEFSKYCKVFISSESKLPDELRKYRVNIPYEKMHDALAFASLFYGESATMASESACLGTPAIFLDNDGRGYTDEQQSQYGIVFNFKETQKEQEESIDKGIQLLDKHSNKIQWLKIKENILNDKIDPTSFFVWFFENYPNSIRLMQEESKI